MFKEINAIKKENYFIKLVNQNLTKEITEIKQKINYLEEQNLGINIEIIGTLKTENENCINIVTDIGKKLNIDLTGY